MERLAAHPMASRLARAWLLALMALLCATRGGIAAPSSTLDLVLIESAETSYATAASRLKQVVEARSSGRLRINLHLDGRFGTRTLEDLDMVSAVRAGTVSMALVSSAPLSNLCAELEVLNDPFLFRDYGHVWRVLDGKVGLELLAAPLRHGLRGLAFFDGGFRLFASTRPIASLSDFRGLRVRTLQNRTYVGLVKAFQGVPVPAAINKIRTMVTRGFIDAADRSYPTYGSLDLYDVLRYVTETNHAYAAKVLIVNEAALAALPREQRDLLVQAVSEVAHRHRDDFRAEIERVRKRALSRGVKIITLSADQRRAFETASRPVQEEVVRLAGRDLVERVRSAASSR